MKKFMIVVMLLPLMVFGQTTIPKPSGVGVDGYVTFSWMIGDYDGDGSNDVFIRWKDSTTSERFLSVYSFKKNIHLLFIVGDVLIQVETFKEQFVSDLDNDGTVEILIRDKIYSFTSVGIKKNSHNSP